MRIAYECIKCIAKFWIENDGIPVDKDAVHCPSCGKTYNVQRIEEE